ncbi:PAS domain S-box-containing protein [Alkalispirochaeta americana]|uniref:histidine kinase n=1 Tax=Alkalispirochaeta americana TaxID=159291 RepID=A0A1N6WY69_9SPIO|nr:histidine kinase dimerization/phosphoacceptor domain -containing protein [Alkalispirochaeta americana]SIQ94965.1 PAS domain S-box-containing protein [Alkalispirochaeta americana]
MERQEQQKEPREAVILLVAQDTLLISFVSQVADSLGYLLSVADTTQTVEELLASLSAPPLVLIDQVSCLESEEMARTVLATGDLPLVFLSSREHAPPRLDTIQSEASSWASLLPGLFPRTSIPRKSDHQTYATTITLALHLFRTQEELLHSRQALSRSEHQYRLLFQHLPLAFAVHEMIYGSDQEPLDYRFIEINPAFEKITGLRREHLLGKTVLAVLPGTERSWIETYAEVVRTGEDALIESYSRELKKYFAVRAFRIHPGHFAVIFTDVTEETHKRKTLQEQARVLGILAEASERFLDLDLGDLDFQEIVETVRSISGAIFVMYNAFSRDGSRTITRAVAGPPDLIADIHETLGQILQGHTWKFDEIRRDLFRESPFHVFSRVSEWSADLAPVELVISLENRWNLGETMCLLLRHEDEFLGDISMVMPAGLSLKNRPQLEIYARNVALVIMRRRSEERIQRLLQEKELLLQETQHRIKNNLNVTASLLSMQALATNQPEAVKTLLDASSRVKTIRRLYEELHLSENFRHLAVQTYLRPLIDEIIAIFPDAGNLQVETDLTDFKISTKLLSSIGLIVNELITNAMKHAFPPDYLSQRGLTPTLRISAREEKGCLYLSVADNGIGLSTSAREWLRTREDQRSFSGSNFGMLVIHSLVEQVDGTLDIQSGEGTTYSITIPLVVF